MSKKDIYKLTEKRFINNNHKYDDKLINYSNNIDNDDHQELINMLTKVIN